MSKNTQEENEEVKKIKQKNLDIVNKLIVSILANAPNKEIQPQYVEECRCFKKDEEDPILFLRNLLDKMMKDHACSDFVAKSILKALSFFPTENPKQAALRRANLFHEKENLT